MNQQYNNLNTRHSPQFVQQNRQSFSTCNTCGKQFKQRQFADHQRDCLAKRQYLHSQRNRQSQQTRRVEYPNRQQHNNHQRQQQGQYQHSHYQIYQHEDADDSDYDQDEEYEQYEPYQMTYTFSTTSNQMPTNIKIQFDNIFGPNGVFPRSMNQMNQIFQCNMSFPNMQINFNGGMQNFNISQQEYDGDQDDTDEEEQNHQEDSDQDENPGLIQEQIDQLPIQQFTGGKVQNCVVCMNNYRIGEKLRILNCMHKFHKNCIDEWLISKAQCPICRFDLK